jgi:hypothetical protein
VVLPPSLSGDPYIMIAEVKARFLTAMHSRINPAWPLLNSIITPGTLPQDFDDLYLLIISLIVLTANFYKPKRTSPYSL